MLYDTSSLIFLSTLSLRRATWADTDYNLSDIISIHALLAESDYMGVTVLGIQHNFYPRSPCGERRSTAGLRRRCCKDFYPRSPCGERLKTGGNLLGGLDFYPRSPCGERHHLPDLRRVGQNISIHALLAESDAVPRCTPTSRPNFYPRSPCGERQHVVNVCRRAVLISIHALLAESDRRPGQTAKANRDFYPRSPCGERRVWMGGLSFNDDFYPRSPCGERRLELFLYYQDNNFYPRSPCGERRRFRASLSAVVTISIHALLAESDHSLD